MDEAGTLSTKDTISFCRSCGGREDELALPGCTKPGNHPSDDD